MVTKYLLQVCQVAFVVLLSSHVFASVPVTLTTVDAQKQVALLAEDVEDTMPLSLTQQSTNYTLAVNAQPITYVIGVLALNSYAEAVEQWQPLANYLTQQLPGLRFQIEPLEFTEVIGATEAKKIDFLIVNPAFFSLVESQFSVYAIATLQRQINHTQMSSFGGVVFSRLGVNVEQVAKLHQEQIAAVAPYSLGGYLVQKKFFKDHFDITLNDKRMAFYESHREVVKAVLSGEKKVGLIRTGILEGSKQGDRLEVFEGFGQQNGALKLTTRLYPEWPFAALSHIPFLVSEQLLPKLLTWQKNSRVGSYTEFEQGLSWTIPKSYQPITKLLQQFQVEPYHPSGSVTLQSWLQEYQEWVLFVLALTLGIILMASLLNRTQLFTRSSSKQLNQLLHKNEQYIRSLELKNQTLASQQERFRLLSDEAPEGVIIFAFSGHIEYINPYALKFWGKENATLKRLNAFHIFSDIDQRQRIHTMLESLTDSMQGPVFLDEFHVKMVHADNRIVTVMARFNGLKHQERWLLALTFRNLEKQKQLKKVYQEAAFLAQAYIHSSDQVMFTFTEQFEMRSINAKGCELFGQQSGVLECESNGVSGLPLENVQEAQFKWLEYCFSAEQSQELMLQLNELKREDKPSYLDYPATVITEGVLRNHDLRLIYVQESQLDENFYLCVAQQSACLQVADGFAVATSSSATMAEEMAQLGHTVAENRTGILVLDPQGDIHYANRAVAQLMNLEVSELLGRHFGIPDELAQTKRHVFDLVTQDGKKGVAEVAYTETLWQGESAFLVFMYDVTDLECAQQQEGVYALRDPVTGLPNRLSLIQFLQEMLDPSVDSHQAFCVVNLAIQEGELLQNTYGPSVMNQLYKQLAKRLQQSVRGQDLLARMGANRFSFVLQGVEQDPSLSVFMHKLTQQLTEPFEVFDTQIMVEIKLGAVMFPAFGDSATSLLKMADLALNKAQKTSNSVWQVFDGSISSAARNELSFEQEIQQAVENRDFFLVYQPCFEVNRNKMVSVEAFLRWEHPRVGELSPETFLQGLEANHKMIQVGLWALEQGLLKMKEWHQDDANFRLALNLSLSQLLSIDFAEQLQQKLLEYQVPTSALAVEVDENVLLQGANLVMRPLQKIQATGVEVRLDNFSLSSGSLQTLKDMPFDCVKLNAEFGEALLASEQEIMHAKTVLNTLKALGLNVMAQGVETEAQKKVLLDFGCSQHQGYLYAAPLSAVAFEKAYIS